MKTSRIIVASNVLVVLLLLVGALSCKSNREAPILAVDPSFGEYISAYTTGLVSANTSITVKFSQPCDNFTKEGDEVFGKPFIFSPSIKGKAYWVNNQEVVFNPESPLKSGERFITRFKLDNFFRVNESKLRIFEFSFRVIPLTMSIELGGLVVENQQNPNTYNLEGRLMISDRVDEKDLAQCVVAKHNGNSLQVAISPTNKLNTYQLLIKGIERESKEGKVEVAWTAKPLGGSTEDAIIFNVPQLSKFVVSSSSIAQVPNQSVSLYFSDLLNPRQNFDGMVEIGENQNFRFEVDRNILKVYPMQRIAEENIVAVDRGIVNILGDKLDDDYSIAYHFEDIKPSLRSVSSGVILPTSEGLVFPFEAVNLKSVLVEIIKIYENNIPYYLQTNRLGESDELNRVGYPVFKKVIDLNQVGVVVPNKRERYTLDLNSLFVADPGAIYRIKISFNKHQLLQPCQGISAEAINESIDVSNFVEPGYFSDYEYYYDDDYDWNRRDDPCNSAYYSEDRKIKQCILSSDIGIIAKLGNNSEMVVAVNNIVNAKPTMGAEVCITDYQNQTIAEGQTNSDGLITLRVSRQPFLVTVKSGKQKGYLRVDNATSNSLSNFDVSGSEVQNGIKGMIYGERGVWRPGDTLHLCFMAEDKQKTIPIGHPIVLEITDSRGAMVKKMVKSHSNVGIYYFPVATDPQAPTGNWHATVKFGGANFTKTLRVETVKPNRLKLNLNILNDKIPTSGNIEAQLNAKWSHGAAAQNMRSIYDITVSKTSAKFPNHSQFTFDDPSIDLPSQTTTLWEGTTGSDGSARVYGSIPKQAEMPAAVNVMFKGRVFEPGGDFSIDLFSKVYNPYSQFVGLQLPAPDAGKSWLETDKDHQVSLATIDANGNPVSCNSLVVELFKISWRWWWEQPDNGEASYVSHDYKNLVMRSTASTINGRGTAKIRIDYPNWGRYFLKVTNRSNGNSCGTFVYFDWPYGMAKSQGDRPGGANILSLAADKQEYNVDEDIKLTFPGVKNGRALISIENGSRVISAYWVDAGNSTNVAAIRVLPSMTPNIYVHVTLLQPHRDKDNDLPIRMFGIVPLKINEPQNVIKPIITLPEEMKSESMVSVVVRENSGQKMNFTLAVVDEGLLDITRYKTPDPYSVFHAREAIGVKTWDLYNDVIGAYGGKMERLLSIGGDEDLKVEESGQVMRFKPVIRFFGPFTIAGGRSKKIDFMMPNYVGSVRVMAVASNDGAYGFAEKSCPVRNDIMVMSTLPRILGPMEEIYVPVNVFVSKSDISKVRLKIRTSDNLDVVGESTQTISFNGETEKMAFFKVKVGSKCGNAKVEISAEGKGTTSKQDVDIEIRNPISETTRSITTVIPADSSINLNFSTFGVEGSNSVSLEASVLPSLNLKKRVDELVTYPHGCLEQTVSGAFPQLYLNHLLELTSKQETDIASFVNVAITKVCRLQNSNGGFRYWPTSTVTDEWTTTYAGHFLFEARNNGYDVSQGIIDKWIGYQQQAARKFSSNANQDNRLTLIQAYRLYSLALAKKPEVGAMNKLKELALELPARMRLAQAYSLIGQNETAISLLENVPLEIAPYNEYSNTFGSDLRDKAIVLETLLLLNQQNKAYPIAIELSNKMSSNCWLSTHESAVMLGALSKMAIGEGKKSNIRLNYVINNHSAVLKSDRPIAQTLLAAIDGSNTIEFINKDKNAIYTNLVVAGIPPLGDEQSFNNNLNMNVRFELNNGESINPANIQQGVDFVCLVTVYNPGLKGSLRELALTQIFPSGWEIQNTRLENFETETSAFTYQDVRDDRILTYFDIRPNESKTFKVKLTATYAGTFYMSGFNCTAMYDNTISAVQAGGWVTVDTVD